MTPVEWTDPAIDDLREIVDFIARDSTDYSRAVAERILMSVDRLQLFPRSGRVVREAKDPMIREIVVFSYRVMYRIRGGRVFVLAVIHGARDVSSLKRNPWRAG